MHRSLHKMLAVASAAVLLLLGVVAPASATTVERAPARDMVEPVDRPTDIAVLSLGCKGGESDTNGKVAGCRWSSTDTARAYQLWRIVDRGHRELVGTYDNSITVARDDVPDDAVLVRYAVIALDSEGEIVGRSRVQRVQFD